MHPVKKSIVLTLDYSIYIQLFCYILFILDYPFYITWSTYIK